MNALLRVRTGALRSPGGNLPRVEERAETQVLISETKKYEESCRQRKQHVSKLGEGRERSIPREQQIVGYGWRI